MKCGGCIRTSFTAEDFESRLVRGVPTPYKSCRKCRAKAKKNNNDPAVKARKKILKKDPKYKKFQDEYNHLPEVKAGRKVYRKTDLGKAANARHATKRKADPGKNLGDRIRHGLNYILSGSRSTANTVFKWTQFKSGVATKRHFQDQFGTSGMSWSNYGWGSDKWNVGHRIARAQYDENNPEDFRRCWSKKNLFPQWQTENMLLGTALPSSEVLAGLADVHPIAWGVSS